MNEELARQALHDAVERVYAVFANYRPGREVSVCRCGRCIEPQSEAELLNAPLREIGHYALSDYHAAANVDSPPGFDPDELRYFLPRMLEFVAADDAASFSDPAVALRRLGECNYRSTWPASEIAAVDGFYCALLDLQLARPIGIAESRFGRRFPFTTLSDILCLCAHGGGVLATLLERWEATSSLTAKQHRATLAYDLARSEEIGHRFPGPFWDALPDASATLRSWVLMPKTLDCLKHALHTESDPDLREAWQTTHDDISTRPHRA